MVGEAIQRASFVFTENRCFLQSEGALAAPPTVVRITAGAFIVGQNYVEGQKGSIAFLLTPASANTGAFTVLGNIVSGNIMIGGAVLGPPWAPLNALVP